MIVLKKETLSEYQLHRVRLVGNNTNEIISILQALEIAEEQGLDLVLVSETSDPPVVKIQDFRKIEYERKKARKAQKKSSSQGTLKEIQMRINISDHDLDTKALRARKFIARGDKVKVLVQLRGRERDYSQRAWELLERFASLSAPCKVNKGTGPMITCLLEPEKALKSQKPS